MFSSPFEDEEPLAGAVVAVGGAPAAAAHGAGAGAGRLAAGVHISRWLPQELPRSAVCDTSGETVSGTSIYTKAHFHSSGI